MLRRHRLWETFLHDKLGFSWDELHEVAEQLEHIQSAQLIERLDAFLDNPKFDPHGDPIPNASGTFTYRNQVSLSLIHETGKEVIMLGVKNQSPEFLKYLQSKKLNPGSKLQIISIGEYDLSLKLVVNQETEVVITNQNAKEIFVKP